MILLLGLVLPFLGTTTIIWLVGIVALIAYFYRYVKKQQSVWERKGIKYIKPKFFVGNFEIIRSKSIPELFLELYDAFPEERYHGVYQFLQPSLIVRDPDLIKQITVKEFDHFVDHRDFVSAEADPFWSRNLLASRGEKWRDLRSTLSPSFTSSKMKIMYNLIDECAQQFVGYFKKDPSEVIEVEMKDTLCRYTNDVIATTAFGIRCNSLEDRQNEFYLMGKEASDFGGLKILRFFLHAISPTLGQLLKIKIIPTKVANYFSKIIEDTIKTREEKKIVRPDMIHLLMEAKKGRQHQEDSSLTVSEGFSSVSESDLIKNRHKKEITVEDINSQAFIFFFAGFETVSTLLNFLFYELAVNPDIQERLRREIEDVSDNLTYETLLSMKYLDMVISEALRKWPPTLITDRKVTKAFTIQPKQPGEKPLHLEEGTICLLPMYAIHRDPKFYSEPEKFDPERFSDENKHKINPSAYFPFGAGPRNCIGSRFALLEAKLIIFHILKDFAVVPVKKTQVPMVLDKNQGTLKAKGGMWLGLKKIANT